MMSEILNNIPLMIGIAIPTYFAWAAVCFFITIEKINNSAISMFLFIAAITAPVWVTLITIGLK